jgi:hypothetical protein
MRQTFIFYIMVDRYMKKDINLIKKLLYECKNKLKL